MSGSNVQKQQSMAKLLSSERDQKVAGLQQQLENKRRSETNCQPATHTHMHMHTHVHSFLMPQHMRIRCLLSLLLMTAPTVLQCIGLGVADEGGPCLGPAHLTLTWIHHTLC